MGKSIVCLRARAFEDQRARCFYCNLPMWNWKPEAFAARWDITQRQTQQFRCTAEHLKARSEGGGNTRENIVAACWICNTRRHRRKRPPEPLRWREIRRSRVYGRMST